MKTKRKITDLRTLLYSKVERLLGPELFAKFITLPKPDTVLMVSLAQIREEILAWPGGRSVEEPTTAIPEIQYFIRPVAVQLKWPGGRSVEEPTTLARLRNKFAAEPEIQELIRRAETPEWSREDAHNLFAAVALRLNNSALFYIIQPNPLEEKEVLAELEEFLRVRKDKAGGADKTNAKTAEDDKIEAARVRKEFKRLLNNAYSEAAALKTMIKSEQYGSKAKVYRLTVDLRNTVATQKKKSRTVPSRDGKK